MLGNKMEKYRKLIEWVYEKNWNFDHLPKIKKELLFLSGIFGVLLIVGVIPIILMMKGFTSVKYFSLLIFLLVYVTFYLFRIPYLKGKLNNYIPLHIHKKIEEEMEESRKRGEVPFDWKLPYLKVLNLSSDATEEDIKKIYSKKIIGWTFKKEI